MHFLGASRDGLVARPVEMDKLSFSAIGSQPIMPKNLPDHWV
jgi:hypothetical protein